MATVTGCPGYATWETLPNWQTQVTVGGQTFIPVFTDQTNKSGIAKLKEAWATYGESIKRAIAGSGVPLPFFMGILAQESRGDPYACAPCGKANGCGLENCQQCCAFGIMQFIDSTARQYVKAPGSALLGNPELSFKAATLFLKDMMRPDGPWKYGYNLPLLAGGYNAGSFPGKDGCGNGRTNWFGNRENDGYTQRVVTYANTFVYLGLEGTATTGSATTSAVLGVGMLAAAGYLYWQYGRK